MSLSTRISTLRALATRQLPESAVGRARTVFAVLLLSGTITTLVGILLDPPEGAARLTASVGGLAVFVGWALWQVRGAWRGPLADVLILSAFATVAVGTGDAEALMALAWTTLFLRATVVHRSWLLALGVVWWLADGLGRVVVGAVETGAWIGLLPGFVLAASFIGMLTAALERLERVLGYQAVLARGGAALAAAASVEEVASATVTSLAALVADRPGCSVGVWRVLDGDLVRVAADPPGPTPVVVPLAAIPEHLAPDASRGTLRRFSADAVSDLQQALGSNARCDDVVARDLLGRDGTAVNGMLTIASPGSLDAELVATVDRYGSEVGLALERVALADELVHSEALFRGLVQSSSDVVVVVDVAGRIRYASPGLRRWTALDPDAVVGAPLRSLVHPDDLGRFDQAWAALGAGVASGGEPVGYHLTDGAGGWRSTEVVVDAFGVHGDAGYVCVMRDVTARTELEQRLAHQAFHDPLTGLANRPLFGDRVEQALLRTARSDRQIGIVLLDLDDFKAINDALGHAAGDALLVEVAERLRRFVRGTDTPARLGGDEFAVVLDDVADADEACRVVQRILEAFARPVRIADRDVMVRTSAGVATGRRDTTLDALLRNADVAMYAAKAAGKDGFEVFQPAMHDAALARLELRMDLEGALGRGELAVVYQPIVELGSDRVAAMEALLRWHHPRRGVLGPDTFIPIAEETGLIVPIGRWVLSEACQQARSWRATASGADIGVNVNLSARQFRDPDLVASVADALTDAGIPASALRLEVTETALVEDVDVATEVLAKLRDLGVRVAIDDFGTGYSSFGYLRRFLVDEIKIDREFVRHAAGGPEDAALLRAILKVGHTLDVRTVAEGVEEAADLAALRAWGCDFAQGYLLAHPMDAGHAAAWLSSRADEMPGALGA